MVALAADEAEARVAELESELEEGNRWRREEGAVQQGLRRWEEKREDEEQEQEHEQEGISTKVARQL